MGKFFGFLGKVVGVIFALIVLSSCGGGAMVSEPAGVALSPETVTLPELPFIVAVAPTATETATPTIEPTATALSPFATLMAEKLAAVRNGVHAYLDWDAEIGNEASWLDGFCAVSSRNACAIAEGKSASIWANIEDEHTRAACGVESAFPDKSFRIGDGSSAEVWNTRVLCTSKNSGKSGVVQSYIVIVHEDGAWKFDHFMEPSEFRDARP